MTSAYPYISPSEYADYGIPNATAGQVDAASRVANNYMGRPEGVLWVPDANGYPAYMAWKNPTISLKLPAPISAGSNVVINLPGSNFGLPQIGEIAILDQANPAKIEACIISAAVPGQITLQTVQFSHGAQATMNFGLTICDELPLAQGRTTLLLTRTPLAAILSGYGRYGYSRRGSEYSGLDVASNLLAYVAAFGGPPQWTQFPLTDIDVNPITGQMWCPPGLLLAYFSDVRVHYCAGWQTNNVPLDIKQAVANLVNAATMSGGMSPSIKTQKAGNATLTRFGNTLVDADTQVLLNPYRAKLFA